MIGLGFEYNIVMKPRGLYYENLTNYIFKNFFDTIEVYFRFYINIIKYLYIINPPFKIPKIGFDYYQFIITKY